MIRYADALPAKIEELVDGHAPNWRAAAKAKTASMATAGMFEEGSPSWSDVKPVYMRLQFNKCVFCERPLGGEVAGKAEQDVEHFRPKNSVKPWPRKAKKGQGSAYPFPTGPDGPGYYWLAYSLDNYAAACKPCNSGRKSNYFPIAGPARGTAAHDLRALNAVEQPLLIFPLGQVDDDPEGLITFDGIIAKARATQGHDRNRGLVTIDFFALNDREELWVDRFRTISDLWFKMQTIMTNPDPEQVAAAKRGLSDSLIESAPQASCARSFLRLIETDTIRAWQTFLAAEEFLKTASRPGRNSKI